MIEWGINKDNGALFEWSPYFESCDWMVRISNENVEKIKKGADYRKVLKMAALMALDDSDEVEPDPVEEDEASPHMPDVPIGEPTPYVPPITQTEQPEYTREILEGLSFQEVRDIVKKVKGVDSLPNQSKDAFIDMILEAQ